MKMVKFSELKSVYGIDFCRQHIWRLEAKKMFPLRVKQGEHHIVWVAAEIEAWLSDQMKARAA